MKQYVIIRYSGYKPVRHYVRAWDERYPDIVYKVTKKASEAVHYQTEREAVTQRARANGAAWDLDVLFDIEEVEA